MTSIFLIYKQHWQFENFLINESTGYMYAAKLAKPPWVLQADLACCTNLPSQRSNLRANNHTFQWDKGAQPDHFTSSARMSQVLKLAG